MDIRIGARRSGKTRAVLNRMHEDPHSVYVSSDIQRARNAWLMSKLGPEHKWRFQVPYTLSTISGRNVSKLLVDDVEDVLSVMLMRPIGMITMTPPYPLVSDPPDGPESHAEPSAEETHPDLPPSIVMP